MAQQPINKAAEAQERLAQLVSTHSPLVEHLIALYPARTPSLTDPEREVWAKAGEQRLVERLRVLLDRQRNG